MKTLNLDNYCVQEMSAVEMREAEGGFFIALAVVAIGLAIMEAIRPIWTSVD